MIKAKHVEYAINILEYFLFIMNFIIAFRLIVTYIDLNLFIDDKTGRMNFIGQNVKFFQTMIVKITNPFIDPFKNILMGLMGQGNSGLVNILAPAFSILVVLLIMAVLKLSAPYIMSYFRKIENNK